MKALFKLYPDFLPKTSEIKAFKIADSDEGLTFLSIFWFWWWRNQNNIEMEESIECFLFVLICGGIFYEVDEDLIFFVFCFKRLG